MKFIDTLKGLLSSNTKQQLLEEQEKAEYYRQKYYAASNKRMAERKRERVLLACCDHVLDEWLYVCEPIEGLDDAIAMLQDELTNYQQTIRKSYSEYKPELFADTESHVSIDSLQPGESSDEL